MVAFAVIGSLLLTLTVVQTQGAERGATNEGSRKPIEQIAEEILREASEYLLDQALQGLKFAAGKSIESIGEAAAIVDEALEVDCADFTCPSGLIREADPGYTPESNGCGSLGFHLPKDLLPDKSMEGCCDKHDFCYDSCGADRDLCDLHFKRCLYEVCNGRRDNWTSSKMKACKGVAKLMYIGTQAAGCKAFQNAQKKACRCVSAKSRITEL